MGTLLPPSSALTRRIRLPFADAMLLLAVLVSGGIAGAFSHPAIWVATPLVAAAVWLACRQRADTTETHEATVASECEWPSPLSRKISDAVESLQHGNARRRLDAVLRKARPLFAVRASTLDNAHQREIHEYATELVAGACDVAVELARLDGVNTRSPRADHPELSLRYERACNELEAWLDESAQAFGALHAAGWRQGTHASDQVAQLATERRHDGKARSAAIGELLDVLSTL